MKIGGGSSKNKDDSENVTPRSFLETINPGYVAAGVATLANSVDTSDGSFYKNVEKSKIWKNEEFKERYGDIQKDFKNAERQAYLDAEGDKPLFTKLMKDVQRDRRVKVDEVIKATSGIEPGFKGAFSRFKVLEPYQQRKVALTIATVASVALGALYSFTKERRLAESLHRQIAKNADDQQQR